MHGLLKGAKKVHQMWAVNKRHEESESRTFEKKKQKIPAHTQGKKTKGHKLSQLIILLKTIVLYGFMQVKVLHKLFN